MDDTLIKRSLNISTNSLNRKIFLNVTLKQILALVVFCIINIAITSVLCITASILGGVIFCGIFLIITICLVVKNCLGLTKLKDLIVWLFTSKQKTQKAMVITDGGIIKYKNKKLMIFEIQTPPLIGSELSIKMKVNKVINSLSTLNNFSIISTQLNFNELQKTEQFIIDKIDCINPKNYNKLELQTLLANQFIIENCISGDYAKNTYLLIIELDQYQSVESIFSWIKTINAELININFKVKQIVEENSLKLCTKNLFNTGNKIKINPNYIFVNEEYNHYIKISGLPSYLEIAYLTAIIDFNFTSDIKIDYSLNTYTFKSSKQEEKIWESNIKYYEFLFNKAKKNKEIQIAEDNIEAIQELSANLIANKNQLVKYDLILKISSKDYRNLKKVVRNFKNYLTKICKFELESGLFNQWELFNNFQRNLLKKPDKNYLILPIDLILWSYPFLYGNNYLSNGLYIGKMDNNNPVFLSLNSGDKKNNSTLIVGKTGSGKSEFIKFLTKNNCAEQNITTIILDPKGEYSLDENIIQLDPQIVNLENSNDINLNPFELCENDSLENRANFILEFIAMFFKNNDFTTEIKNIILGVITKIINSDDELSFSSIYQYLKNIIVTNNNDFYMNSYKTICNVLEPLLPDGVYGYFSKKSNFEIKSRLVIFNLSPLLTNNNDANKIKLKLLLAKIKKYIYTKNHLINSGNKIQLICDEFPVLANPNLPFVANEFVTMIRLIRSYDTSLVLAMQDIDTLKSRDAGSLEQIKSIANNTKHIFLFHLNQDQLNEMKNLWGDAVELSKEESIRIATDFNPGDCLYINGADRYYINVTDPTKAYSPYYEMIWTYINDMMKEIN